MKKLDWGEWDDKSRDKEKTDLFLNGKRLTIGDIKYIIALNIAKQSSPMR